MRFRQICRYCIAESGQICYLGQRRPQELSVSAQAGCGQVGRHRHVPEIRWFDSSQPDDESATSSSQSRRIENGRIYPECPKSCRASTAPRFWQGHLEPSLSGRSRAYCAPRCAFRARTPRRAGQALTKPVRDRLTPMAASGCSSAGRAWSSQMARSRVRVPSSARGTLPYCEQYRTRLVVLEHSSRRGSEIPPSPRCFLCLHLPTLIFHF